jgi:hypothetical protein
VLSIIGAVALLFVLIIVVPGPRYEAKKFQSSIDQRELAAVILLPVSRRDSLVSSTIVISDKNLTTEIQRGFKQLHPTSFDHPATIWEADVMLIFGNGTRVVCTMQRVNVHGALTGRMDIRNGYFDATLECGQAIGLIERIALKK